MTEIVDPKEFDLPPRTVLEKIDKDKFAFVINRKSRIVMADGKKILQKATKIKASIPDAEVVLKTTAPVCSKTKQFLGDEGIELEIIES